MRAVAPGSLLPLIVSVIALLNAQTIPVRSVESTPLSSPPAFHTQADVSISERTIAGLERARKAGRVGGRRPLVVDRTKIAELDADGLTQREIGGMMGISAAAVCRILKAHHLPALMPQICGD